MNRHGAMRLCNRLAAITIVLIGVNAPSGCGRSSRDVPAVFAHAPRITASPASDSSRREPNRILSHVASQFMETGTRALKDGRFVEAAGALTRAANLSPMDGNAQTMAGLACLRVHRLKEARRYAENAVNADRSRPAPYLLLARVYGAQGDHKLSTETVQQYLAHASNPSAGYYLMGALTYQWSDYPAAETWLRRSAQADPANPEAWYLLGQIARVLRPASTDEAVDYYNRAISLRPQYADAHAAMARALMDKGDSREAVSHLRVALHGAGDLAPIYYSLGQALFRSGRRVEGEQALAQYRVHRRSGHRADTDETGQTGQ